MSSLMSRMKKASIIDKACQMDKSEFFNAKSGIHLPVPVMNLAYSGRLDGQVGPGLHLVCGPSKHFKSNLCLVAVKAFLDANPEGIVLFYDSEFGSVPEYWTGLGVDVSRVLHLPIKNMEEFKFDLMKKLEDLNEVAKNRGKNDPEEKVFIYVDSLGALASKKEVDDALKESGAADMTRAKVGKGMARMVTPYLKDLNITCFAIQHTYDTIEMYSKKVVSGGQGWILAADTIFIMGKRQVKDGAELAGFEFVMNTDKSRFIKERSAIPITVTFEGGIDRFSGLLDIALSVGWVTKPKNGWYTRPSVTDDKNWREKDTRTAEFWEPLLSDKKFNDEVAALFKLTSPKTFTVETIDGEKVDTSTGEILSEEDEFSLEEHFDLES